MNSPSKLTILCDTREQRPWPFDPEKVEVVRATLRAGDYSLPGLEDRIAIERKTLGDFVGTVVGQWLRFVKELNKLACYDSACIVVEANLDDVYEKRYEAEVLPASVVGRANAIYLDYGIPCFFWGPANQAADMATRFLTLAWKKMS